jgi:acyl-CoA thioesterase FadM
VIDTRIVTLHGASIGVAQAAHERKRSLLASGELTNVAIDAQIVAKHAAIDHL